jgi:hypothetical protein
VRMWMRLLGEGERAQLWCALAVDEHAVPGGRGVGEGLLSTPFFARAGGCRRDGASSGRCCGCRVVKG